MATLLQGEGFAVDYINYPTDQIGDLKTLADGLRDEILAVLDDPARNPDGATKVDIVAHSMGGLVTRAFMANMHPSADNDPDARYNNEIRRLIMVGTPNYGTSLGGWGGLNVFCTTTPGPVRDAQAEQMRYGSNFLWVLHNKWTEFVQAQPEAVSRILVVAGTGGPGWNDGVVNVSSAALANGSTEAVRYVPYIHTGALRLIGTTGRVLVNVPPSTPDPCSVSHGVSPDPYCGDVGVNHKTFRFVEPFLSSGHIPSQAEVWADVPNFDEGALLLHVVDGQGPIPPDATRSLHLDFTPLPGFYAEHKNDTNSTFTAAGLRADPAQTYTVKVTAHNYLPTDTNGITIERARTTVAEVALSPGADLLVESLAPVAGSSTRVRPGRSISLAIALKNQGIADAGSSKTGFVLSGPDIGGATTLLGDRSTFGPSAGTTGPVSIISLTIPRGKPAGCYILGASADANGEVAELDETNNVKSFPLSVGGKELKITTRRLPMAKVGVPYGVQLSASGSYPPYSWDLAGGALPDSFSPLTSDGRITGTPTTVGSSILSVRVRGSGPCGAEEAVIKQFILFVRP